MIEKLGEWISESDEVTDVRVDKQSRENEKGILAAAIEFAASPLGQTIISTLLVEGLKSIFAHFKGPKEYRWELTASGDGMQSGKICVYRKNGAVIVDTDEKTSEEAGDEEC